MVTAYRGSIVTEADGTHLLTPMAFMAWPGLACGRRGIRRPTSSQFAGAA